MGINKRYILIFVTTLFIASISPAQKFDAGFTITPLTINKLEFDKKAIILEDDKSYDIGEEKPCLGYPTLMGIFSSGIYIRFDKYHWYLKTEMNYQTKSFRYTNKSLQFNKLYFYYSCIEVPIVFGIRLNPENIVRYKLQAGVNLEYGKFNHNSFISPFYMLGININENKSMLNRISPLIYYYHVGIGFDYYGISFDLRCEKNINNINKDLSEFNANFTNIYSVRLCIGFRITGRHWDKYRRIKTELNRINV